MPHTHRAFSESNEPLRRHAKRYMADGQVQSTIPGGYLQ